MTSAHKHQMSRHGRTRRTSTSGGWGSRAEAPVADEAQGGGSPVRRSTSRTTGRGLTRSGLFSYSCCARRVLPDVAPGRFARGPLIGRTVYKFSAALLIGRSHQLNRIGHKPGSDIADPLHVRLSKFVGFNTDEPMRGRTQNAGIPFQGRA